MSQFRLLSRPLVNISNAKRVNKSSSLPKRSFSSNGQGQGPSFLISPQDAFALMNDKNEKVKFVDIQDPRIFPSGHIEGATNVFDLFTYLATSDNDGVAHMQKTLEKVIKENGIDGDEKIITYEGALNSLFGASCRGWYIFNLLGHTNVQVLDGGLAAWKEAQLPLAIGEETKPTTEGKFVARWNSSLWANLSDVVAVQSGKFPAKLLDVRDQVEWDGHSSSPYGVDFAPRKGRLDNAVHIPWYNFMQSVDGDEEIVDKESVSRFKSPDRIREMMLKAGFDTEDPIIVYCFKGARASNSLMALKAAGFKNVKNYFASWNEWSRHEKLSIDAKVFVKQSI